MKRLLWLAAVAIVLGVGLWFGSGAAIDAGRLKGELERDVRRATGREFTIAGPLHITLGWAPAISAEGISLANVAGGSAPSMLTADRVQADVALLPLLAGRIVVQEVALQGATVLVETAPDGSLNWQFQAQQHALVPGGDAPSRGGGHALDVHRVSLRDSHATWRLASGRAITAELGDAVLFADSPDSPMHASAHGTVLGVPASVTVLSGSFSRLQGGPVTALAGTWALDVSATAGDATLKLSGGVNHPDEWRGYSFRVTANAPDMTPLLAWMPPALALPLHDVNLTARLSDGSNGTFHSSAVSLHSGPADLGSVVPGLALREALLSAPGPGQQAQLNVDGTYQGQIFGLAGTTTQPDLLAAGAPLPVTFSARAGGASLSVHGTMPATLAGNGFDLAVDLHVPNLADLSGLARRTLPDVRDVEFGAHLGDAGFRLRGLDMRDIGLQSSLGDAAGNLTVAWAPVWTLNGALTAKQFDLDAAAQAWSMATARAAPDPATQPGVPAAQAAPAPRLFADTKLDFDALRGADSDLTLAADRLSVGGQAYRDVTARIQAEGGRIVINPLRMTAPQGILVGGLTVDASAAPPQLALTLRAPGLSADKVATALGYPGGASGSLQVDAELTASGGSPHALASTLGGHLGLSLVNGTVSDTVLQTMLGAALSRAGVPAFGGDVAVRCFASRTDFAHGIGQVRALALDTAQLSMSGDGSLDLANETLALHLRPAVRLGGTAIAAPISLNGGFYDLHPALDPVLGGRVGLTIGGPPPGGSACSGQLAASRGGQPGPAPAKPPPGATPPRKPVDLLRGLFH